MSDFHFPSLSLFSTRGNVSARNLQESRQTTRDVRKLWFN